MKKHISHFLSKPKIAIVVFGVLGLIVVSLAYNHVGTAPIIPSTIMVPITSSTAPADASNVSLGFTQGGNLAAISVVYGDTVYKGQILAKLSAPQAEGAVQQAKGALDLAEAQYASLNNQYSTTKKQQDTLVDNAYRTLLSSGLEAVPNKQDTNTAVISGTYTCGKEGSYILKPYASGDSDSGYSINFSGLETGLIGVKYDTPVALGNCGLQIKFLKTDTFNQFTTWTIAIPNTKSAVYLANKNAYDLAVNNREKILTDLALTIGTDTASNSVAKAQIDVARGAYQTALGAYQNTLIVSPIDGIVTFVDKDLKVGQSVTANKPVISISAQQ